MPLPEQIRIQLTNLEYNESEITIKNWGLDDNDIETLVNLLVDNPTVTSLNLKRNNITSRGAILLAQIANLKKLNISQNKIDDKGAIALSKNKSLEELDISDNDLSDTGGNALKEQSKCSILNFQDNLKMSIDLRNVKQSDYSKPQSDAQKMQNDIVTVGQNDTKDIEDMLCKLHQTALHAGLDAYANDAQNITIEVPLKRL